MQQVAGCRLQAVTERSRSVAGMSAEALAKADCRRSLSEVEVLQVAGLDGRRPGWVNQIQSLY